MRRTPSSDSTSDVLPAPFGPISATRWPRSIANVPVRTSSLSPASTRASSTSSTSRPGPHRLREPERERPLLARPVDELDPLDALGARRGLARTRAGPELVDEALQPRELGLLALERLGLLRDRERLLLAVRGVAPFEHPRATGFELDDAGRDGLEEPAVVRRPARRRCRATGARARATRATPGRGGSSARRAAAGRGASRARGRARRASARRRRTCAGRGRGRPRRSRGRAGSTRAASATSSRRRARARPAPRSTRACVSSSWSPAAIRCSSAASRSSVSCRSARLSPTYAISDLPRRAGRPLVVQRDARVAREADLARRRAPISPARIRSSVVLPDPLRPTSARRCPGVTRNETSLNSASAP